MKLFIIMKYFCNNAIWFIDKTLFVALYQLDPALKKLRLDSLEEHSLSPDGTKVAKYARKTKEISVFNVSDLEKENVPKIFSTNKGSDENSLIRLKWVDNRRILLICRQKIAVSTI